MELSGDGNSVLYKKWLFTRANYPCGGCKSPDDVVFMRTSPLNEVIRSCEYCGVTQPVSAIDEDSQTIIAQPFNQETHEMTIDEIKDFIERNEISQTFVPPAIARLIENVRKRREINIDDLGLEKETQ
jgi:hypothetical protein